MPNEQNADNGEVQWVDAPAGEPGVTTETAPRHMKFVRVSRDELNDLKSANSTLELAFFGISFGALLTVSTTLATVDLPDLPKTVFIALTVMFLLAAVYFGAATVRGELRWRKKIKALMEPDA
jgi:hypothetical protein